MKYLQLTTLYSGMLNELFDNSFQNNSIDPVTMKNKIKNSFIESHRWPYYLPKRNFQIENFIVNDYFLQKYWCTNNGINFKSKNNWYFQIIIEQINFYKPDILFLSSEALLSGSQVKFLKNNFSFIKKIILWTGVLNSLKNNYLIKNVDEIFTSCKTIYDKLKLVKKVQLIYFAFDKNILKNIKDGEKKHEIIFLGNIFLERELHGKRSEILNYLTKKHKINFFSNLKNYSFKNFLKNFVYKFFKLSEYKNFNFFKEINFYNNLYELKKINQSNNLYGLKQFEKLSQYWMILNTHANNINCSSNIRLFEATGVGSCLFTENSKNISDLFDKNKEIITFENKEDLNEKINYLKKNHLEIEKIGKNAQKKVLKKHIFEERILEFESKIKDGI